MAEIKLDQISHSYSPRPQTDADFALKKIEPQEAMDRPAGEMDQVMARMQAADESADVYGGCGPRLNEEKEASEWLGKGGAKAKLENEKPPGETIAYEELIKQWAQ